MADKYVLICNQINLSQKTGEGNTSVLEIGAEARLKTYLNGVMKGLRIGGFKTHHGFRNSQVASKDDVSYQFEILTNAEWIAY